MPKHIIAFAIMGAAASAHAQEIALDADAIKTACSAEWGTEFEMVKFCMDERASAFQKYSKILESANDAIRPSLTHCQNNWGEEWDMVLFCANEQATSMAGLPGTVAGLPDEIGTQILQSCTVEWGVEFDMVSFCATERANGWRAINQ